MKDLHEAFPRLSEGWFSVLSARLKAEAFSGERLTAAVDDLIKTCEYPEPTIARVLAFDRKVTLLDYEAMCEKWTQGLGKFYKMVRKADTTHQPLWASTDDIERCRLPVYETPRAPTPLPPDDSSVGVPMPAELKQELESTTMTTKTRLSQDAFESSRKRAQGALRDDHVELEEAFYAGMNQMKQSNWNKITPREAFVRWMKDKNLQALRDAKGGPDESVPRGTR